MRFEDFSAADRGDIVNNKRNVTFTATKATLRTPGYASAPRSSLKPTHVEMPPTPVALTPESFGTIFVGAGDDMPGTWLRFYLVVYLLGGRIFYRDLSGDDIEVVVQF